ncbi:MAG TPA: peptidylprolyl isomerase, partial [Patescibacteria group bacterium]
MVKKDKKENKNVKFSTMIYALLVIIAVFLLVSGVLIYKFGFNNRFTQVLTKIIPYPAAVINFTDFVSVRTLQTELIAVRRFYENQDFSNIGFRVDFKTVDGQKRLKIKEKNLLNKLIENEIIKQLAEKRDIKINSEIITQEVDRKLVQYGSREAFLNNLKNLYGWNISDFEEKIVKPDMRKAQLQTNLQENDKEMSSAKNKIDEAKKELDNKTDFSEIAKKFSDGESAKNGGDLGWLSSDQ